MWTRYENVDTSQTPKRRIDMKILADATPQGSYTKRYLVEASEEELSQIQGFRTRHHGGSLPIIGQEVNVTKAFQLIGQLNSMPGQIETALKTLSLIVAILGDQLPMYLAMVKQEEDTHNETA
jgi:hypothetical protein